MTQIVTPALLGQAALSAVDQVIYTVPTGKKATVRNQEVCNTSGLMRKLTVYVVPFGGSAGDQHAACKDLEVPIIAGDPDVVTLNSGDSIIAHADAPGLTMSVYGAEIDL
jgi:hypothetical protein